jgi:hypothetical protein
MTEKELRAILEKAIWAPSGDNCQPWHFEWDGKMLTIKHDASRALHPLDPQGVASTIAFGCLLESIDIAAAELGYACQTSLLDMKPRGVSRWVEVKFEPTTPKTSALADALLKRATDRRPFQGGTLEPQMFHKAKEGKAQLHFVSKPSKELIRFVVEAEQLLVHIREVLPATMHWVRFSQAEARRTGDGMSWRNMGTKFWEVPAMPLLRDFPIAHFLARFCMAPQHRFRVTKQLDTSAGIVCVSAPSPIQERVALVDSGKLMMNAWLSLTQHAYGVQPLTLASLVGLCALEGVMELPETWMQFFRSGEKLLQNSFGIPEGNTATWMIRAGKSTPLPQKAKTFRRPLSEILTIKG